MSKQKSVYDIIKRQNGEAFARAIRIYDSGIFEIPNLPEIVRYAGREAEPILAFLESLKMGDKKEVFETDKDPFQLLNEAGYDAFYADSLEKQNAIQKYFAKGEELCTFKDEMRYKNYHIIHAVKKNVDSIKRTDFLEPERHDAYATSVISIQILKRGSFIKICNRYNHSVRYPDNTFNSNPDNIIKGLSDSLSRYFDVDFSGTAVALGSDFILVGKQIFKINFEADNVYFGDDFYIKNGEIFNINKDYEMLIESTIIDFKNATCYSPLWWKTPALTNLLNAEFLNAKLQVQKNGNEKRIFANQQEIVRLKEGNITGIYSRKASKLDSFFLHTHEHIEEFVCENVTKIGANCLSYCSNLRLIKLPKMKEMGSGCVCENPKLETFFAPELNCLAPDSLCCVGLQELDLPKVQYVKGRAITNCPKLERVSMPNLCVADMICNCCDHLIDIEMPRLEKIQCDSFCMLLSVQKLYFPELQSVKGSFNNLPSLNLIKLPKMQVVDGVGDSFSRIGCEMVSFPQLEKVSGHFLNQNNQLKKVFLPRLVKAGPKMLATCVVLREAYLNALEHLEIDFLRDTSHLVLLRLDNVQGVSSYFEREKLFDIANVYAPKLSTKYIDDMMKRFEKQGLLTNELRQKIFMFKKRRLVLPNVQKIASQSALKVGLSSCTLENVVYNRA